jgi:hypothetical protein
VELPDGPAVVKQVLDAGGNAGSRFRREVMALRLAAGVSPQVVPALLGVDEPERVMVLEYLPAGRSSGPWAVDYATALARLHAAGAVGAGLPRQAHPTEEDVTAFLALAAAVGVQVSGQVRDELDAAVIRLANSGQWALLHGDPCPDNTIRTSSGLRFVDLEHACSGDGITELAYLRIGFPTCWCAQQIKSPDLAAAEDAYADTWLAATGQPVPSTMADACLGWLLTAGSLVDFERRAKGAAYFTDIIRADWRWGTASARQRLQHRVRVVAAATEGHGELAAILPFAENFATELARQWPELRALPDHLDASPLRPHQPDTRSR